jgi:hypothetical protein
MQYDSWLTIGVDDASRLDEMMSIGIPWADWVKTVLRMVY